mgnify:CR=1 FL=1
MPLLKSLMKYNSNPPQYFLNVGEGEEEKRIELKSLEILKKDQIY